VGCNFLCQPIRPCRVHVWLIRSVSAWLRWCMQFYTRVEQAGTWRDLDPYNVTLTLTKHFKQHRLVHSKLAYTRSCAIGPVAPYQQSEVQRNCTQRQARVAATWPINVSWRGKTYMHIEDELGSTCKHTHFGTCLGASICQAQGIYTPYALIWRSVSGRTSCWIYCSYNVHTSLSNPF